MRKEHKSIQFLSPVLLFTSASSKGEVFSQARLSPGVSVVKGTFRPIFFHGLLLFIALPPSCTPHSKVL